MSKFLVSAATGAAFLLSGAALVSAAGPICTVPGDYATIQGAVNDAGCTTINVAAGTYAEHVTINRAVTINGANAGTSGTSTIRVAESIVDGTNTGAPFTITANNVTIDGFTIRNGANGNNAGVAIPIGVSSGYKLLNNIITNNSIGVYANCVSNCLIQRNLFDANNTPGSSGGAGIYTETTNGLTVNLNEFKNHAINNPIIFASVGADVHQNDVISNNYIHNNPCSCSAIYALSLKNASFTANNITSDGSNIRLGGGNHTVAITKNILSGGTVGVNVVDDGYLIGLNTGVTVNRNSITAHSIFGVDNSTGGQATPVDATCNWWGAANGPGPVGPGSGDKVSTNVNFTPWLTSNDLNGPCQGGGQATTKDQCKDGGWQYLKDDQGHSFKNQGDCVSFVATKGKNKGAGQ